MRLYTDIDPQCCAVLGSRVEDGSLPPGDVMLADVRTLTPQVLAPYRHVHLFAGIGGFPLGLEWAGWLDWLSVVTFGFPCQDISAAGKGEGLSGSRSGLFWEARRIVHEHQPDVCIAENVGALSRRGLDVVAGAMGEAGYVVPDAYRVGAWALGAPHVRERWWIVGWRRAFVDARSGGCRAERFVSPRSDAHGGGAGLQPDAKGSRSGRVSTRSRRPEQAPAHADRMRKGEIFPDASPLGLGARPGDSGDESDARLGWGEPPAIDRFIRNERREWQYAGPPLLVYAGRAGRQEPDAAAESGDQRHAAGRLDPVLGNADGERRRLNEPGRGSQGRAVVGRPDPTLERGWPVPVLPGYQQHDWELARLYQRGMGCAVHGLSGRMADSLNKCGLMAVGNAIVPQVCAAIARGILAGVRA